MLLDNKHYFSFLSKTLSACVKIEHNINYHRQTRHLLITKYLI